MTFNLAVTLAVEGRVRDGAVVRACRPVCLLRDGIDRSPRRWELAGYCSTHTLRRTRTGWARTS
jgi:hypothetical protein